MPRRTAFVLQVGARRPRQPGGAHAGREPPAPLAGGGLDPPAPLLGLEWRPHDPTIRGESVDGRDDDLLVATHASSSTTTPRSACLRQLALGSLAAALEGANRHAELRGHLDVVVLLNARAPHDTGTQRSDRSGVDR